MSLRAGAAGARVSRSVEHDCSGIQRSAETQPGGGYLLTRGKLGIFAPMPPISSRLMPAVLACMSLALAPEAVGADGNRVREFGTARLLEAASRSMPGPLPRREVLDLAGRAYQCARSRGEITRPVLTVIDYSRPSREERMWVFDMARGELVFRELVAHGRNSGAQLAHEFSNVIGSRQTSLGLFRTADTYYGKHGYSLNLVGLEQDVNHNALRRRIVIHGADYVGPDVLEERGELGRSWGCPAVSYEVSRSLIEKIKDGSALFAYYPDLEWLDSSTFLRCDGIASASLEGVGGDATPRR